MLVFANAKINLGLNVINKRSDGFHNIETIMYPIKLYDIVEIVETQKSSSSLNISGTEVEGEIKDNLCMRALNLLKSHFSFPEVDIFLHKNIPTGAGLGGGSSDAANVLLVLNKMFELNIGTNELITYASQLGSDCAFFIKNTPQLASGKGDVLQTINIDLSNYQIVLVKPNFGVNTAKAYASIKPQKPAVPLSNIILQPAETWKNQLKNDFEEAIFPNFPEIEKIKQQLYEIGAVYASMSGSGSSVFALFNKKPDLSIFNEKYFIFTDKEL